MRLSTVVASALLSFTIMGSAFADDASKQTLTKEQVDQIIDLGHKSAEEFRKHYVEIRRIQRTTYGSAAKDGAWDGAFDPIVRVGEFISKMPESGPNGHLTILPVILLASFVVGAPFAPLGAAIGAIRGPINHRSDVCSLDSKLDNTHADACALRHSLESVNLSSIDDATINALTEKVYDMGPKYKKLIERNQNYQHVYPESYFPSIVILKGTATYDLVKAVLEKRFRNTVSPEMFNTLCEKMGLETDEEKLQILGSMYFLLKAQQWSRWDNNAVMDYLNFAYLPAAKDDKQDL